MGVKETPTNFRVYYTSMINAFTQKRKEIVEAKDLLEKLLNENYNVISNNEKLYEENFGIKLSKYNDYNNNHYNDGKFLKVSKGLYLNKVNDYELSSDLFDLYNVANQQKKVYDYKKEIQLYDKILKLSLKQYTEILRLYATEIHKALILEGEGFAFGNNIGWICINRCILKRPRPHIDYAATKKREAELKAAGKKIYNKEEAEWCQKNGLDYQAEDKRVFTTNEYCYEIPLIDCKLTNGTKLKLNIADYRHASLRGKTNDQLIEECKFDTKKICELGLDVKTKLTLCDKADKILYTKFIRNEAQKPVTAKPIDR